MLSYQGWGQTIQTAIGYNEFPYEYCEVVQVSVTTTYNYYILLYSPDNIQPYSPVGITNNSNTYLINIYISIYDNFHTTYCWIVLLIHTAVLRMNIYELT